MAAEKKLIKHEVKEKKVNKILEDLKNSKTLMIVSIAGLPSKQFQSIKKKLRENAKVIVSKKNIIQRVLDKFGKESISPLKEEIKENFALIISNLDGFKLAGILNQNKNPIFAKAGQIAPDDIEVKEGPTDLVPGPAISELGALGIQIAVEDGKISIKKSKTIVHKGEEIQPEVASMLQKLNIQPFSIGLEPIAVYDIQDEKIYKNIKIDSEEAISNLQNAASKALGFAQKIIYYCKDTIGYILSKANSEAKKINEINKNKDSKKENKDEDNNSDNAESKENEKIEGDNTQLNNVEEKA